MWCIIPAASTVASDACPSSILRAPSVGESATLVLCHGKGGESHLIICSLSADGSGLSVPQCWGRGKLVSVTSVWPALLLMRAAVSHRCSVFAHSLVIKSDAYMCKCGRPLSLKPPPPCPLLSAFGLSPLPPQCGRPLWMRMTPRRTLATAFVANRVDYEYELT